MLKIKPPFYQFCPFCGKKLGIKILEGKQRKFCATCDWIYFPNVADAVAAVFVKENKVLMVKRAREPYKGTWMFPAGFIDFGESPEEALAREVKEETGMRLTGAKLMTIFQSADDCRNPGHFCFFYKIEAEEDGLATDPEENSDIGWMEIKNPPEIGWKGHQEVMTLLQKGEV